MRNLLIIAATAVTIFGATSTANACSPGLIADILCRSGVIDQRTANGLDYWNGALGKPTERIGGAVLDYIVPGTGFLVR